MARKAFQRTQKNTSEQPREYAPFNLKNMTREEAIKEIKSWDFLNEKESEAVRTLIPELRESEDERMMRMIGLALTDVPEERFTSLGATLKDCLAYLERQKDHFRDDTKMVEQKPRDYCSVRDEFDLEGNLVHKPTSTEDMPYITDEHFYERESADSFKYKLAEYMTKCCTKKEGPYGYTYGISAEAILKMAEEELLERGVVQKPAEWSEEDEKMLKSILWVLESYVSKDECGESPSLTATYPTYFKEIAWLKSLRPQPHWKPNEEQMMELSYASKVMWESESRRKALKSLYEELLKL